MIQRLITPITSLAILSSLSCASEVIKLKNGNSFTGKLSDSDVPAVLHLVHPFAESPIKIKEASIQQILFEHNNESSSHQENIKLINGDHFPCSITSINSESVSLNSKIMGKHTIDRSQITEINFNTKSNKTIYSGPGDDLSAWTTTSEDWELENGILSIDTRSDANIQIPDLTKNYILRFTTKRNKIAPHFRLYFSSNNDSADKKSDHYYIDFNSHGITLYRSQLGKYQSLVQVLGNHESFSKPEINISVHVDRKHQKLAFYINDNLIKTTTETTPAPEGNYLIIKNHQREGIPTQISNIEILSWNGKVSSTTDNTATSLDKHDLITDLSGNVIAGKILSMADTASVKVKFEVPFAKNGSVIAKSELNLLEFKHAPDNMNLVKSNFALKLTNGGSVSFSDSQFNNSQFKLSHPILGSISIPQTSVFSINAKSEEIESKETQPNSSK